MQAYQRGNATQMQSVATAIAEAIRDAHAKDRIYSDTSHGFIKGFGWLLMEQMPEEDIGVIILKRDKQAVVRSTFRAKSGPLRKLGRRFILTPDRLNPINRPPGFAGLGPRAGYVLARRLHRMVIKTRRMRKRFGLSASDVQLFEAYQKAAIDWYWEETYALGDAFRQKYPNCTYFDTSTEDLNDAQNVQNLFAHFGVTPTQALLDKIGVPTNLKL